MHHRHFSSELLLSTQQLSAERAYRPLFSAIDMQLFAGQVLRITGPNGAGKSTLLKILTGISSDYSGEIFWRGQTIQSVRDDFQRETVFLGHNKAVKPGLTVAENLLWFKALYPCHTVVTIVDILAQVGLAAYQHTLCAQLSAGQQQRVALARLLLSEAKLWILDEPFTAVDKQGVADFEQMISDFVELGGSVIITTHHDLQLSVPIHVLELGV